MPSRTPRRRRKSAQLRSGETDGDPRRGRTRGGGVGTRGARRGRGGGRKPRPRLWPSWTPRAPRLRSSARSWTRSLPPPQAGRGARGGGGTRGGNRARRREPCDGARGGGAPDSRAADAAVSREEAAVEEAKSARGRALEDMERLAQEAESARRDAADARALVELGGGRARWRRSRRRDRAGGEDPAAASRAGGGARRLRVRTRADVAAAQAEAAEGRPNAKDWRRSRRSARELGDVARRRATSGARRERVEQAVAGRRRRFGGVPREVDGLRAPPWRPRDPESAENSPGGGGGGGATLGDEICEMASFSEPEFAARVRQKRGGRCRRNVGRRRLGRAPAERGRSRRPRRRPKLPRRRARTRRARCDEVTDLEAKLFGGRASRLAPRPDTLAVEAKRDAGAKRARDTRWRDALSPKRGDRGSADRGGDRREEAPSEAAGCSRRS